MRSSGNAKKIIDEHKNTVAVAMPALVTLCNLFKMMMHPRSQSVDNTCFSSLLIANSTNNFNFKRHHKAQL